MRIVDLTKAPYSLTGQGYEGGTLQGAVDDADPGDVLDLGGVTVRFGPPTGQLNLLVDKAITLRNGGIIVTSGRGITIAPNVVASELTMNAAMANGVTCTVSPGDTTIAAENHGLSSGDRALLATVQATDGTPFVHERVEVLSVAGDVVTLRRPLTLDVPDDTPCRLLAHPTTLVGVAVEDMVISGHTNQAVYAVWVDGFRAEALLCSGGIQPWAIGAYAQNATDVLIYGCKVEGGYAGCVFAGVEGLVVEDCTIDTLSGFGVFCDEPCMDVTIDGNRITGASIAGIQCSRASDLLVRSNVIRRCGAGLAGRVGIIVKACLRPVVDDNVIIMPTLAGQYAFQDSVAVRLFWEGWSHYENTPALVTGNRGHGAAVPGVQNGFPTVPASALGNLVASGNELG